MKKNNVLIPKLVVPKGYDVWDYFDTDDLDYEMEEPILVEEVEITFER